MCKKTYMAVFVDENNNQYIAISNSENKAVTSVKNFFLNENTTYSDIDEKNIITIALSSEMTTCIPADIINIPSPKTSISDIDTDALFIKVRNHISYFHCFAVCSLSIRHKVTKIVTYNVLKNLKELPLNNFTNEDIENLIKKISSKDVEDVIKPLTNQNSNSASISNYKRVTNNSFDNVNDCYLIKLFKGINNDDEVVAARVYTSGSISFLPEFNSDPLVISAVEEIFLNKLKDKKCLP